MEEADERDEFSTIASGAGNSLVGHAGWLDDLPQSLLELGEEIERAMMNVDLLLY
jgi:hypothetical protein